MARSKPHSSQALFGRSVDDYLLYEACFFTDKVAHEMEDRYIVEVSVPGFKPAHLDLRAQGDTLFLRGFEVTKKRRPFFTSIEKIPIFQRSLVLPTDVAPNTISARYVPGLVQIICPKQILSSMHHRDHYLVATRKIKIQQGTDDKGARWRKWLPF